VPESILTPAEASIATADLRRVRDKSLARAASLVVGAEAGGRSSLSMSELSTFGTEVQRATVLDNFADLVSKSDREREQRAWTVKSEPRTYSPDGPHSWYIDTIRAAIPALGDAEAANRRLERHGVEIAHEVRARSPEGVRALGIAATRGRQGADSGEARALSSGSGSGGAFVSPYYLSQSGQVGFWNSYPPAVLSQATSIPDPGYGLEISLGTITAGVTVAQQVGENSGVANSSPTGVAAIATLVTHVGEVDVSQQLLDRTASQTMGIDAVLHAELLMQLTTARDAYVIAQMIAAGGSFAGQSTFTVAKMFGDLAGTKAQMLTAAGALIRASHVFAAPAVCEWLMASVDPNGRPVLLPTAPDASTALREPCPGYTGYSILGTPLFADGSIPASGSNAPILVASMPDVLTVTSEPAWRIIPETFATDLTVVVQMYGFAGTVQRHSAAAQVLTGGAYPQVPTFA
jgi:hypothetical protein